VDYLERKQALLLEECAEHAGCNRPVTAAVSSGALHGVRQVFMAMYPTAAAKPPVDESFVDPATIRVPPLKKKETP
jgi:hypothetical protein